MQGAINVPTNINYVLSNSFIVPFGLTIYANNMCSYVTSDIWMLALE